METGLRHLHSTLRWVVLILMIVAIAKAFNAWRNKQAFGGTRKLALYAMITLHLQLVIGLVLYFTRGWYKKWSDENMMSDTLTRFFTMEHLVVMILAIALATIGYSGAKRMSDEIKQNRRVFIYYVISFILILSSIPWPFREALRRDWF